MKKINIKTILVCSLILLGLANTGNLSAQEHTLKLISYNVYWGMRQDSTENKSRFTQWIKTQNPDIIALQEMNGFTQKALEEMAGRYGHPYAILLREPAPDGSISFPVAITSKYPIINVRRVTDNMGHGMITAEILGNHYIVTHFHPFSAVRRGYEIDQILATVQSYPQDTRWLLMGDLNSVSPLDKTEYDNGNLLSFIREDMKKRPQNENLLRNELDYTVQQKILDAGFVDVFKNFHPAFEASAPTKLFYDQSKFPLRYDYLYVSGNMQNNLVSSRIIKDEFTDIYSDHYPVELIFNNK